MTSSKEEPIKEEKHEPKKEKEGLFRSIFIAHIILLLQILLLAVAGVTILLFKGVYHYLPWIMGGLGILILLTAWFFYREMRSKSSDLAQVLSMPQFQDREVEVKLIGGLASFKMGAPKDNPALPHTTGAGGTSRALLAEPEKTTEEKLVALISLHEKNLITKEEFETAKKELIHG